jgi:hypothetical protein
MKKAFIIGGLLLPDSTDFCWRRADNKWQG